MKALAVLAMVAGGALAVACASETAGDAEAASDSEAVTGTGPMMLVGSFDGSQGFSFWTRSLALARALGSETRRPVHFTYFVNGAHLKMLTAAEASRTECGAASSLPEVRTRFALMQQAVAEGHEIANHSTLHESGGSWWDGQWLADITAMDAVVGGNLFEPVRDDHGALVFPKWVARGSGDQLGAACTKDSDCESGLCLELAKDRAFCSRECNAKSACPSSFTCGGAGWESSFRWGNAEIKDVCVPEPEYPVVHEGRELFDADGAPNPDAIDRTPDRSDAEKPLKPYKMVGLRAPYLAMPFGPHPRTGTFVAPLWSALGKRGYRYSSSQGGLLDREQLANAGGSRGLWELPLVPAVAGRPMAADGVYRKPPPGSWGPLTPSGSISAATMRADYRAGVLARYRKRAKGTRHFGIVEHFSPWETDDLGLYACAPHGFDGLRWQTRCGDSYHNAFADTIAWAARGCPTDDGATKQCPDLVVGSYAELMPILDADARTR